MAFPPIIYQPVDFQDNSLSSSFVPTTNNHLTNKFYVDTGLGTKQDALSGTGFVKISGSTISYDSTNYLPLAGGTMTGFITLHLAPTNSMHPANKGYVDSVIPSQTGHSGKYLTTNGTVVSWATVSGTGTVTSVDMSVPTGLSISGNPITTNGTLAISYSAGYSLPLTADTSKGITAHGWGNHAIAGYLTTISGISAGGDLTGTYVNPTIANSAVSLTKMADVATGTIFYRKTAGTGSPEVQTLATLKTDLALWGLTGNAGTTAGTNYIGTSDAIDLVFKTGGTERARFVNSTGRFGIGTSSPSYHFEIKTGTAGWAFDSINQAFGTTFGTAGGYYLYGEAPGSSTGTILISGGSTRGDNSRNAFVFKINNTEYMRIDGNYAGGGAIGNVGIGYTNPAYKLDVNGTARVTTLLGGTSFDIANTLSTTINLGGVTTTFNFGGGHTSSLTANYFANATASGQTKTLNYGTAGASGSTTTMNFGSTVSGAINSYTFNNGDLFVYGLRIGRGLNKDIESTTVGYNGLLSTTSGTINTTMGFDAGRRITSGTYNSCFGAYAGSQITTGTQNGVFGANAGLNITAGGYNIAVGTNSLANITITNSNVGIGVGAGYGLTGSENMALGGDAARRITSGDYNVATGSEALYGNNNAATGNVGIGRRALYNVAGNEQTGIGYLVLYNSTGNYNVGMGSTAGYDNTSGTTNVYLGYNSGRGIRTCSNNTIVGANVSGLSSSLSNHVLISDGAGNIRFVAFNDGNVYIGATTSVPTNGGYKLEVAGTAKISGQVRLSGLQTGNSGLSTGDLYKDSAVNILAAGDWVVGMKV